VCKGGKCENEFFLGNFLTGLRRHAHIRVVSRPVERTAGWEWRNDDDDDDDDGDGDGDGGGVKNSVREKAVAAVDVG